LINISERMKLLADCVLRARPAADIGTDHGLVPIYLLKQNICPSVILTDVSPSSLNKGIDNINSLGLSADFRCGDGLEPLKQGEVSTVIIAGMGGELISRIIGADLEKSRSFKRFVLQPRKRTSVLRRYLYENGFKEISESLVREGPNICEVIVAEPLEEGMQPEEIDFYFPKLLFEDALFSDYLDLQLGRIKLVLDNLENAVQRDDAKLSFWSERLKEAVELRGKYGHS